jgi:hypothetical protein
VKRIGSSSASLIAWARCRGLVRAARSIPRPARRDCPRTGLRRPDRSKVIAADRVGVCRER